MSADRNTNINPSKKMNLNSEHPKTCMEKIFKNIICQNQRSVLLFNQHNTEVECKQLMQL